MENLLRLLARSPLICLSLCFACAASEAAEANWPLSLNQALALAQERNYDLKLARAALASAQANIEIAAAPPNPTLGISTGSISPSNGIGAGSLWRKQVDTVFSVGQLIERGDKRELRTEGARHNARAADADLQDVQRQLRVLVAQAYADLQAAQERLLSSRESSQLLDDTLTAAQIRRTAGDIAGADVERVRVDALRAKNDVVLAENELHRARRFLALLLGESAHADNLQASDNWPALEEAELADDKSMQLTIERIVAQRADVRAAIARVEAADTGTRLAQSLRTRDVSVGMQFEHYPQTSDASSNSLGFSVQVPLFVRYYYQGEISSAAAALDVATETLARTKANASAEISTALASLRSAAERVRRNRDELLIAAEKSARAAEYAYKNGALGVMDVLDARRTLRATQLDALTAQADFSKALASWKAAKATTQDVKQ